MPVVRFEYLRRSVHNQERVPAKKLFESPLGVVSSTLAKGPFHDGAPLHSCSMAGRVRDRCTVILGQ